MIWSSLIGHHDALRRVGPRFTSTPPGRWRFGERTAGGPQLASEIFGAYDDGITATSVGQSVPSDLPAGAEPCAETPRPVAAVVTVRLSIAP